MRTFLYVTIFSIIIACGSGTVDQSTVEEEQLIEKKGSIKYATGFSIEYHDTYKVITLKSSWKGENTPFKYVLYDGEAPQNIDGAIFIKTPIKTIACMSLTHVAFIEKLEQENSILGLSGCDYVHSEKLIKRISNGFIKEIGNDAALNYELIVDQNPNILMTFGVDQSSKGKLNKLEELGVSTVLNAEYMETHPLGKTEWIKFVAAFYNLDEKAEVIFNEIEEEYHALTKLTQQVKNRPTVFSGMPWSGTWYVPGGKSFQAQLFKDAGADYLWADNEETSSITKSIETIIVDAYEADYWLNLNSYNSIDEVVNYDEKLKGFKAIKSKRLFNNNNRTNSKFGNDYWESGVVEPQIVLKDLIKIFHSELLEHELYYYKKLK